MPWLLRVIDLNDSPTSTRVDGSSSNKASRISSKYSIRRNSLPTMNPKPSYESVSVGTSPMGIHYHTSAVSKELSDLVHLYSAFQKT